jgi:hypothetical protein
MQSLVHDYFYHTYGRHIKGSHEWCFECAQIFDIMTVLEAIVFRIFKVTYEYHMQTHYKNNIIQFTFYGG